MLGGIPAADKISLRRRIQLADDAIVGVNRAAARSFYHRWDGTTPGFFR